MPCRQTMLLLLISFAFAALQTPLAWAAVPPDRRPLTTVDSPDGQLRVTVTESVYMNGDRRSLSWQVDRVDDGKVVPILTDARLIYSFKVPATVGPVRKIEDRYRAVHGKRTECGGPYNEVAITAAESIYVLHHDEAARRSRQATSTDVQLTLRVADDGVAWQFETDRPVNSSKPADLCFEIPETSKTWVAPYDKSSQWTPAYEVYYHNGLPAARVPPSEHGWAFPALFELTGGRGWLLATEAAVPEDYCATRLTPATSRNDSSSVAYSLRFPDQAEGNGVGDVVPTGRTTPWYVFIIGKDLSTVVGSTLVQDLNPPCRIKDTSWIRPGRAAWSWWSDSDSPKSYQRQIPFIDLAAEMGWEYYLVDANWTLMDGGNVREMARYAEEKGVGLILWYNSGGAHNIVTEKPRGCMTQRPIRRFEMDLLRTWGVKAIKVDFFQSDKEAAMRLYHEILEDAAEYGLMVDFHGCTLPSGWSRTWPNLMTMESVRGAECYKFDSSYPEMAPVQNTIIPFTRNVVGPMDYTPVTFTKMNNARRTTVAHELALSVIFESALQHFADQVSAYRELPEAPKNFLKTVPAAWDDTRLLDGRPGEFVVLARRKGDTWYVAGISGRDEPLQVDLKLDFLDRKPSKALLITDGADGESFRSSEQTPRSVTLLPRGGFVLRLER